MKVSCVCGIGLSFAIALNSAAGAAPDISGTYWATSYSPTIPVLGGGDPPLNAAGKAAYEMTRAGLKDGSIVDKARRVCVPDGVPRVLATPYPFEIFQAPAGQVTFLYEMNHQVRALGALDDGLPDFLVNDVPDVKDYPDTIYLSDGTTAPALLTQSTIEPK